MSHFIDGRNAKKSNWLKYVNCATSQEVQNLSAIQIVDKIYYRADKEIEANTELLVWYGDNYAQELGLISRNLGTSMDLTRRDGVLCVATMQLLL